MPYIVKDFAYLSPGKTFEKYYTNFIKIKITGKGLYIENSYDTQMVIKD